MSPYSNRVMSQIELVANAENALATARTALALPQTEAIADMITRALSHASFLIWAVSQEITDPTAPDAQTPAYVTGTTPPRLKMEQ